MFKVISKVYPLYIKDLHNLYVLKSIKIKLFIKILEEKC